MGSPPQPPVETSRKRGLQMFDEAVNDIKRQKVHNYPTEFYPDDDDSYL